MNFSSLKSKNPKNHNSSKLWFLIIVSPQCRGSSKLCPQSCNSQSRGSWGKQSLLTQLLCCLEHCMLEHMGIEERKWYQGSDKVAGHHRKGKKHQEQGKVYLESCNGLPVQGKQKRAQFGALCSEWSSSGDRGWTGSSSSREVPEEQRHQPSRSGGCNTKAEPRCMTPPASLLE